MFFQGLNLVIGNVGDSRAVLGTRDHEDSLIAVQLTVDLKPNLPSTSLSLFSPPFPPCVYLLNELDKLENSISLFYFP